MAVAPCLRQSTSPTLLCISFSSMAGRVFGEKIEDYRSSLDSVYHYLFIHVPILPSSASSYLFVEWK